MPRFNLGDPSSFDPRNDPNSPLGQILRGENPITDPGGLIGPGGSIKNPITDPGGAIGPGGTLQNPLIGDKLGEYLAALRSVLGAPYRFWGDGGDGMHSNSASEVLRDGESCSGLLVWGFRAVGLTPPFTGTYSAKRAVLGAGGEDFDPAKEYPIGTFIVGTGGAEGHMAVVSAGGNTLIQSDQTDGANEGKTIQQMLDTGLPEMQFEVAGTFSDLGSATTSGSAVSGAVDAASDAVSGIKSLADLAKSLPGILAGGIAEGVLRVLRAIYAYAILRPLDFAGGFWWELSRRFLKWLQTGGFGSNWALAGAAESAAETEGNTKQEGQAFTDEDKKRIYFILFVLSTYYLAFGRDQDGQHHFDKLASGAANLFNRDMYGRKTYNNRATVRARPHGVTVARRKARPVTTRRTVEARREVAEHGVYRAGKSERRVTRGNAERDPTTGKFKKKQADRTEKAREAAQETRETPDSSENGHKPEATRRTQGARRTNKQS